MSDSIIDNETKSLLEFASVYKTLSNTFIIIFNNDSNEKVLTLKLNNTFVKTGQIISFKDKESAQTYLKILQSKLT